MEARLCCYEQLIKEVDKFTCREKERERVATRNFGFRTKKQKQRSTFWIFSLPSLPFPFVVPTLKSNNFTFIIYFSLFVSGNLSLISAFGLSFSCDPQ
ncbi:hypothetical protein IMY05_003G0106100 [Salix suchowensis]|nr:hypothetical protein IMY05_003G0106100 [Salix suchowensis]